MVTVYLDLAFVLNFCVNLLLLRGTAQLGAAAARKSRILAAAAIGAGYAVLVYFPPFYALRSFPIKLVVAAVMLLTAFGAKRATLRMAAIFGALSLVLCGAVYGVQAVLGRPPIYRSGLLYPVTFASLLLTALAVSMACRLLLPRLTHAPDSIVPLTLTLGKRTVHLTALRDSGNTLCDPISGERVLTADWRVAERLLPISVSREEFFCPTALALRLRTYSPRLIPYRAVGVESGLLLALPCKIECDGKTRIGPVAFSPTGVSDGGAYEILTGGMTHE